MECKKIRISYFLTCIIFVFRRLRKGRNLQKYHTYQNYSVASADAPTKGQIFRHGEKIIKKALKSQILLLLPPPDKKHRNLKRQHGDPSNKIRPGKTVKASVQNVNHDPGAQKAGGHVQDGADERYL